MAEQKKRKARMRTVSEKVQRKMLRGKITTRVMPKVAAEALMTAISRAMLKDGDKGDKKPTSPPFLCTLDLEVPGTLEFKIHLPQFKWHLTD